MKKKRRIKRFRCECGQRKQSAGIQACEQCIFLDGERFGTAHLIAAMRQLGGVATVTDLQRMKVASGSQRSILRSLQRLQREARVVARRGEVSYDQVVYVLITERAYATRVAA